MWIDILVVAVTGLAQVVTTWYAVDISLKERRLRNAFIIGILGAIGIGLTVWGAIRSGEAQNKLQAQLDSIQKNTENPPKVTVNIPPSPNTPKVATPRADLVAVFTDPEDLELIISNQSETTAQEPTFQTFLTNLDLPEPNILPIGRQTGDFLKGHASLLRIPILHYGNTAALSGLKLGTRIFGWISLSCSDCTKIRYYYVYYEYKQGGWYSESSTEPIPNKLYSNFAALSNKSMSLDQFVSADKRIPITSDKGVNRFPEQGTLR